MTNQISLEVKTFYKDNADLLSGITLEAIDKQMAEKSLREYVSQAWHVLEPANPFVTGWHIDIICEHLQAISEGQIHRLIINIPFRHMKSLNVCAFWPSWEWGPNNHPSVSWLYSSYADSLVTRDSRNTRNLIQSSWYQKLWGDRFAFTSDQNAKHNFENDKRGYRIATTVRGVGTGEGADRIICFPFNTIIETDIGEIEIGKIVIDRLPVNVLSYCHGHGTKEYQPITEYYESESEELIDIEMEDGEIKTCTPDHPVYVQGKGYIPACELEENDGLLVSD